MKRYWPHLGPRVAGHRWASASALAAESLSLTSAQSEIATFARSITEAIGLSAGQIERGTFAETVAESLALSGSQVGTLPVAPLLAATGSYRSTQPNLFVDALASTQFTTGSFGSFATPPDPAVADPKVGFDWGDMAGSSSLGPSYTHVESANEGKWLWANPGGDWINTAGSAQSTSNPHFTFTAANGTNTNSAITATAGAQAAYARGKWNAYIVRGSNGNCALASHHHTSLAAPFMSVTYLDGSTATLACVACVPLVNGSTIGRIGGPTALVNPSVCLEFQMPTKVVASATITIVTINSGSTTISAYLASPALNANPVTTGIAASYTLDNGIAAEGSILFTQRMLDGTTISDYVLNTVDAPNTDELSLWDPELYGGSANANLLPTKYSGINVGGTNKWFHRGDIAYSANVTFVNSSYSGDGFAAPFPGVGAMRVVIPKFAGATGSVVGFGLGTGCSMWALFPKAIAGLVNETYVRFMFRIAGSAKTIAASKMFRTSSGGTASYDTGSMRVGKFGIGSHHWTRFGGNAQDGGANLGHSARMGFTYHYADAPLAGVGMRVHTLDMVRGPTTAYTGKDMAMGAIGGMGGAVYPDRWYTIEIRKKLNTYNPGTGASSNDGIFEIWLDGVLVAQHSGWNFRDGLLSAEPLASMAAAQPTLFKPFREMGDFGLSMDHYVGGNHRPDEDFIVFYSMIAAATQRVGPVTPPLPTYVPAAGDTASFTTGGGVLTNAWHNIFDPTGIGYDPNVSWHCTDYSSIFLHKDWRSFGGVVIWGGGHAGTNYNGVSIASFNYSTITFECVQSPTAWTGGVLNTGDNTGQYNSFGEATVGLPGRIASPHSYGNADVIDGKLTQSQGVAAGHLGLKDGAACHELDLTDPSIANTARQWVRRINGRFASASSGASAPWISRYVKAQDRIYVCHRAGGVPTNFHWIDRKTNAFVEGSNVGFAYPASSLESGGMQYVQARDLLVCCYRSGAGALVVEYANVAAGVTQPTAVTATLSQGITVPDEWQGFSYCEDSQRILLFNVNSQPGNVYEVTIPATLTNAWSVTFHTLPGGRTIVPPTLSVYGHCDYNPKTKCVAFLPNHLSGSGNDVVQLYRPRGT